MRWSQPPETPTVPYAELHCHSNFSFLDGVNDPEELIEEAVRLGLDALAITDHDGFYAASRFAEAAAAYPLRTIYGAELSLGLTEPQNGVADPEGQHLLVLAQGVAGLPPAVRGDHRRPSCAVTRRAGRSTTSTSWPSRPTVTGSSSPAAARARSVRPWTAPDPPPRPRSWTG